MPRRLGIALAWDRDEALERMVERLAPAEQGLARAIDSPRRRRHFALGREAARRAITCLDGPGSPRAPVVRGPSGEPVVDAPPSRTVIRVSVSHSGRVGAACAWRSLDAGLAVGVDVERVRETGVGESSWAFEPGEQRRLARGDALAGLRAWVAKEAAWKALGLAPSCGPEALELLGMSRGVVRLRVVAPRTPTPPPLRGALRVMVREIRGPDSFYLVAIAAVRRYRECA